MPRCDAWGINSVFTRERRSLRHIWFVRYFILVFAVLAIAGASSVYLIQRAALDEQLSGVEAMAKSIALVLGDAGRLPDDPEVVQHWTEQARRAGLRGEAIVLVVDARGEIIRSYAPEAEAEAVLSDSVSLPEMLKIAGDAGTASPRTPYLVGAHPIEHGELQGAYVLYLLHGGNLAGAVFAHRWPRFIVISSFFLAGWVIIYFFTRRMVRPIQVAAAAAKQMVNGDYDVGLDTDRDEREIHELMSSLTQLARRLRHLESLRTQLLAGVTHELKTPVAAISGLVQALRDGIVDGDDAKEYLELCQIESQRMQRMVEDLLDFNSFAANSVTIRWETFNLQKAIVEIADRWNHFQERPGIEAFVDDGPSSARWEVRSDPRRIEQILVNLLNNARDAITDSGCITVSLRAQSDAFAVEVADSGGGIAPGDVEYIFEPFYRGKKKLHQFRGLGLGLPFSRLIARSLGGDLVLTETGPQGTIFILWLPRRSADGEPMK